MEKLELKKLEEVQNTLAASLLKQAKSVGLAAKDWVQGGWSRGKDKIHVGLLKDNIKR